MSAARPEVIAGFDTALGMSAAADAALRRVKPHVDIGNELQFAANERLHLAQSSPPLPQPNGGMAIDRMP